MSGLPPALDEADLVQKAHASNPDIQHIVQERTIEASRLSSLKWQRVPNIDIQGGVDLNSPPDFNAGPRGPVAMSLAIFSRTQGEIAQLNANLNERDLSLASSRERVAVS